MLNEFHTLDGQCASLVPQGPGYENVSLANQVCTTVGSVPGQLTVNGMRYVELSYGYAYSHLWRVGGSQYSPLCIIAHGMPQNFGIVMAFGLAFIGCYLMFTELNTGSAFEHAITLFRQGSNTPFLEDAEEDLRIDEEKPKDTARESLGTGAKPSVEKVEQLAGAPIMTDVFSWHHIGYSVPVGHGETRQLLEDVSGYVAPGKLTALMGESGAGKVGRSS